MTEKHLEDMFNNEAKIDPFWNEAHPCNLLADCISGVIETFKPFSVGSNFVLKEKRITLCKELFDNWGPQKFSNYTYMIAARTR